MEHKKIINLIDNKISERLMMAELRKFQKIHSKIIQAHLRNT